MNITDVANRAMKIARSRNLSVARSASLALRECGYGNPQQPVRVSIIANDTGVDEKCSLITAVTRELGRRGRFSRGHVTKMRQEQLSLPL